MAEFLSEYALFLAQAITIVVSILVVAGGIAAVIGRRRPDSVENVEIKHLNDQYDRMARTLKTGMLVKGKRRQFLRRWKREHKRGRRGTTDSAARQRIFVLDFHGDLLASAVTALRQEVTAILTVAEPGDRVLVRLESAGGAVHAYGLAASQIARFKERKVPVTVAVDKVAASGGYMMACTAEHIIAAPFAVVGSIGVVAQLPNFHRLLEKNDIDFELFTAGEFKRTITLFGENTDKARAKFRAEIEEVHQLFKEFVKENRPVLDLAEVATGEHWYGTRALEMKLVDELRTSDDYLLEASRDADLYEVTFHAKKGFWARILPSMEGDVAQRLVPY